MLPKIVISPRSTFTSMGRPSRWVRQSTSPTRDRCARRNHSVPAGGAGIVRNLSALNRWPSDPMRCCHTRIGPEPSHLIATAMAIIRGQVNSRSAQAITRSPKRISPSRDRSCRTPMEDADRFVGSWIPRFSEPLPSELRLSLAGKRLIINGLAKCSSSGVARHRRFLSPGRPKAKRAADIFVQGCAKLPHRALYRSARVPARAEWHDGRNLKIGYGDHGAAA